MCLLAEMSSGEPSVISEVVQEVHKPLVPGNMEACLELLNTISEEFSKAYLKIQEDTNSK